MCIIVCTFSAVLWLHTTLYCPVPQVLLPASVCAGKVRQLSEPDTSERFDSLWKIDEQVDLLFPVTETARLRLFAQQVSNCSRTSNTSTDAIITAAAAVAVGGTTCSSARSTTELDKALASGVSPTDTATGGSPPNDGTATHTHGTAGTTAAASTASDDPPFSATGERTNENTADGLSGVSSPSHSAAAGLPTRHTLESLRSLEGMQRFMSSSTTLGVDRSMSTSGSPTRGASRVPIVDVDAREEFTDFNYWKLDGVSVSSELEGLIAEEEAEQLRASTSNSNAKKSGWSLR